MRSLPSVATKLCAVALVLGERSVGSRVPMLAGVRKGRTVWKLELPAERPLDATEDDPTGFTIAAGTAYASYERTDEKGFRLAAVTLADGKRVWETPVVLKDNPGTTYVAANERHVFLATVNQLFAFSAADGRMVWSHGLK